MGHMKESQTESRGMCTNLAFDPFYCRPLGMDFVNVNAMQARAYMATSGINEEHLANIVVRSRKNAKKNPYARNNVLVKEDDVMKSPLLSDPLRELHYYPATDWAFGMLLCNEKRAKEFTDKPVWMTGFANCIDSYFLGDKDLTSNFTLKNATERALKKAGIKGLKNNFELYELCDHAAYQLPMWAEGIGLIKDGDGGKWISEGGLDECNINISGGMLNGNPLLLGGAARVIECFYQLRGEADKRQVKGVKRALAQSTYGAAGQHQAVVIMEV